VIGRIIRFLHREAQSRRDPVAFARSLGVRMGSGCEFFGTTAATWGGEPYLITLGNRVMITAGVRFITHDGTVLLFRDRYPTLDLVGPIRLGDNVFVGMNSIILHGVTIGSNCVIGAGSVVNRDIPSGQVAAGVPARVICTLDEWWEKHSPRFLHTHGLPEDEKRRIFLETCYPAPVGQTGPG
jgi:UDP-3-O-[3-hydroxymyristoyl] glucosamine N-acyltransferase